MASIPTPHPHQARRKFLLILPLLTLPFLTLAFWALQGGSRIRKEPLKTHTGLNQSLPEAKLQDRPQDKLTLYDQAGKSATQEQTPFGQKILSDLGLLPEPGQPDSILQSYPDSDPSLQEENFLRQIRLLERDIYRNSGNPVTTHPAPTPTSLEHHFPTQSKVPLRGELQPTESRANSTAEDPEIRQLDGMLEKILDIQHPDRVKKRLASGVGKTSPDPIQIIPARDTASPTPRNTIAAVVHADQTVTTGSLVKLRLTEDILLGGRMLPRNSFLFGNCRVEDARLKITVTSILLGETILPVSLTAFDLDGQEGLAAPGSLTRDALRESTVNTAQDVQVLSLDPSLSSRAAGEGFQAIKNLFRRKVKMVKVKAKAGHRLLLYDNNHR